MRQKQPTTQPQPFSEHAHIINYTFRLHKCACANIKVGVAAKLRREKFSPTNKQGFEDSNLFPSPNMHISTHIHVHTHID